MLGTVANKNDADLISSNIKDGVDITLTTISYRGNNDPLIFAMERQGLVYFKSIYAEDKTFFPAYKLVPRP